MAHVKTIVAAVMATGAILSASPVFAHARLLASTPVAKSVGAAPAALSVSFDDPLVKAFSKLTVVMPMGHQSMAVPLATRFTNHNKTIVGTPRKALAKGSYALNWTAATADGHRTTGSVPFQVR